MRYFRAAPEVYTSVCSQLDAAYGYPNPATKTLRSLPVTESLPVDALGRVYAAIENVFCDYDLPSEILPQLIAAGLVEEITAEAYEAVLSPIPE